VPRKRSPTLAEVAFLNLRAEYGGGLSGTLKATKKSAEAVATFAALSMAAVNGASEDGWPTQAEYAAYWKITERQAQREWALVRRAFPSEDSPDRIARQLANDHRARLSRAADPSFAFSIDAAAVGVG
jgi:hypothetical protein